MEEEQVEMMVLVGYSDPELLRNEAEVATEFEKELLQVRYQCRFEFGLGVSRALLKAEELQDIRIAQHRRRGIDQLSLFGESKQGILVSGETGALVEHAVDLALQFAHRPAALEDFKFIECSLQRI